MPQLTLLRKILLVLPRSGLRRSLVSASSAFGKSVSKKKRLVFRQGNRREILGLRVPSYMLSKKE